VEALRRALAVLGPELLQFGSDRFLPCSGRHVKDAIEEVNDLFDQLNLDSQGRQSIMGGTAAAWLGLDGVVNSEQWTVDSEQ
jgi:hypothetical protein